jgi:uncharacterized iron-regulated membrane protein
MATVRTDARRIHKYLSLAAAAFWLLQALSGIAISFRAEIDDWLLTGVSTGTSVQALGERIKQAERDGLHVSGMWATGGIPGQYDIYVSSPEGDRTVRVDGASQVLRDRSDQEKFSDGAVFETLTTFHKSLLLGSTGSVLIGISGILLLTNIALGFTAAWPARNRWRALTTRPRGPAAARIVGWHRLLGLWMAVPAAILVTAGIQLAFADTIEATVDGGLAEPTSAPAGPYRLDPGDAMAQALARYPGGELTALSMPGEDAPWYRIRLRADGEIPRQFGATTVWISAVDGSVLADHDARSSRPARRLMEWLYPIHTGQIGAVPGRLLNFAIGCWLVTMIVLGLLSWQRRARRVSESRRPAAGQ